MFKRIYLLSLLLVLISFSEYAIAQKSTVQFLWCSDIHLGLIKPDFRGQKNVTASEVNAAMVIQMNQMPNNYLPKDDGVGAGEKVGAIEAVIITGDICNRQETGIQSASISWKQFEDNFIEKLQVKSKNGSNASLLLTPGNHDISNAIGFHRPMEPLVDNASLVGMYNLMMKPTLPKSTKDFQFEKDQIHYSQNIGEVHLMFVSAWPSSSERVWMQEDLKAIPENMPAFIFTHADPVPEARFFQNPNGQGSVNATDKFENLVLEKFKDGKSVKDSSIIEQRGFVNFLKAHTNIKAYFHGHTNYAEFYQWDGPDKNIALPCFRSDSPMKGRVSAKDETKLSFNVISFDTEKRQMTVRECFWNAHPSDISQKIEWGIYKTISY